MFERYVLGLIKREKGRERERTREYANTHYRNNGIKYEKKHWKKVNGIGRKYESKSITQMLCK